MLDGISCEANSRSFIRTQKSFCQHECSLKRARAIIRHSMVMLPSREHESQSQRHWSKTPTTSPKPRSDTGSVGREMPTSGLGHHTRNNGEDRERSQSRVGSRNSIYRKSPGCNHRVSFSPTTNIHCQEASKRQRNSQIETRPVTIFMVRRQAILEFDISLFRFPLRNAFSKSVEHSRNHFRANTSAFPCLPL